MTEHPLHVAIDCRKAADLGIGRYITGLTHALTRVAPEVRLTLLAHPDSASLLPSEATLRLTRIGHYRPHEPHAIGRLFDDIGADVLHAPHYVYPVTRVPGVVTIHDLIHLQLEGIVALPRRLYARAMISRAIRDSEAILTVSAASASAIRQLWPEASGRLHITPNGVDERFFAIRRDVDRKRPYLLVVGNDKPHKNLDRLVDAWRRAPRGEARLILVGSAPERFRDVNGVELRGRVDDAGLDQLLGGATGLVFPSLEEGFGLPLLEAMAAGVPVAASSIPPVREVAADATIPFDPLDVDAIDVAITGLLTLNADFERQIAVGRTRAADFTWDRTAELTLPVYRQIAGRER